MFPVPLRHATVGSPPWLRSGPLNGSRSHPPVRPDGGPEGPNLLQTCLALPDGHIGLKRENLEKRRSPKRTPLYNGISNGIMYIYIYTYICMFVIEIQAWRLSETVPLHFHYSDGHFLYIGPCVVGSTEE